MKLSIERLALLLLVAGSVSAVAALQARKGSPSAFARSCAGTAALIQVSSSTDPVPWVSTDDFAVMVRNSVTIPMSTGGTTCGSLHAGGLDTDFPTSGTYNAVTGFFMDASNNNATVAPLAAYTKNTVPAQGDEWTSVVTLDSGNACNLTDPYGNTVWFYKACLNSLTRDE